ncbi:MFS transporter [Mycobacterium sp. MUNTM1]
MIVFVLLVTTVAYVDRTNLSVSAPLLIKEFHTNPAVMGVLLSSFSWTYTLLNAPAGILVDRVGPRVAYTAALSVWSLASFLGAAANSVASMFGPRLLLGVGESPFIPAAVRTVSDWLPRTERGLGSSVFISGVSLGSAVGPALLAPLVSAYGWRSSFVATGALSAVVAGAWWLWYRHPTQDKRLSADELELIERGQEPYPSQGRAPWQTLLKHREIWAITAGYFCLMYVLYTFVSWVPSYLVADRHLSLLKSGWLSSVPWICAFVVTLIGGRLSDVAYQRGLSALSARKLVLVAGMAAALAVLGTAFSTSSTVAVACLCVSTSGISLANGASWAATQDVVRHLNLSGSAAGMINGVSNVGGLLGPIVTGFLAYVTASFAIPLAAAAGLAAVGSLAWLLGIRSQPTPPTATRRDRPARR